MLSSSSAVSPMHGKQAALYFWETQQPNSELWTFFFLFNKRCAGAFSPLNAWVQHHSSKGWDCFKIALTLPCGENFHSVTKWKKKKEKEICLNVRHNEHVAVWMSWAKVVLMPQIWEAGLWREKKKQVCLVASFEPTCVLQAITDPSSWFEKYPSKKKIEKKKTSARWRQD